MKKSYSGFTFIELMIAISVLAIMMAIAVFGYRAYEARYRCQAIAQILAMDLRLQQERTRTLDEPQGIYFFSKTQYFLGSGTSITDFTHASPRRNVDLTQQYYGITIDKIHDDTSTTSIDNSPPYYIYFDPKAVDTATNTWTPLSGFHGYILIKGGYSNVYVIVGADKEISVEIK